MAEQRILLIRLSHLGDVVHALPVYHALRAAHPRAELAWLVQGEFAGLLAGLPGLAAVLAFERRGGARAWLELRAALAAFAPELVVDLGDLRDVRVALAGAVLHLLLEALRSLVGRVRIEDVHPQEEALGGGLPLHRSLLGLEAREELGYRGLGHFRARHPGRLIGRGNPCRLRCRLAGLLGETAQLGLRGGHEECEGEQGAGQAECTARHVETPWLR